MRGITWSIACILLAASAWAGEPVVKTVPFALGTWTDLDYKEGPVELHRIRLVEETGTITKSTIFRPTGSEYLKTVQIQLEYSNASTKDWKVYIQYEWVDSDGDVIDGYRDDENLDDKESHDVDTVTLSTLKYGLAKAKQIKLRLEVRPD